jgi:SagB-type dehydrogenase family enzyme
MGIIDYLKSKEEPLRSFLRSSLSWACESEEVFTAFATIIKAASQADREDFLGVLGPGARKAIEDAMAEMPVTDETAAVKAENSCLTEAQRLEPVFEKRLKISDEAKRRARAERVRLQSGMPLEDDVISDQMLGLPQPQAPSDEGRIIVALPEPDQTTLANDSLFACVAKRKSRRAWIEGALSLAELSWLCWSTQGLRGKHAGASIFLRTVPSAGARHPFDTYLAVRAVEGLEPGIWRYRPRTHDLAFHGTIGNFKDTLDEAALGQGFTGSSAVVFIWSAKPYRTEWRYPETAHKAILLDAGHVCQNLYLACEAIGCGTCAIGAYDQKKMDSLLGLDGIEDMTVYLSPVGRAKDQPGRA